MKEFVVKSIPRDEDLNVNGTVFGGWTLSLLDSAAMRYARNHCPGMMATGKMNNVKFISPIFPDEVVKAFATAYEVRETEVEVHMELYASTTGQFESQERLVMVADVVGVAIDEQGKRRKI
jgi:acyl-CoA thioesterase YciA